MIRLNDKSDIAPLGLGEFEEFPAEVWQVKYSSISGIWPFTSKRPNTTTVDLFGNDWLDVCFPTELEAERAIVTGQALPDGRRWADPYPALTTFEELKEERLTTDGTRIVGAVLLNSDGKELSRRYWVQE